MYIYIYIYIYVYVCIYIYIYTHTHTYVLLGPEGAPAGEADALLSDDECAARDGGAACAVNALQVGTNQASAQDRNPVGDLVENASSLLGGGRGGEEMDWGPPSKGRSTLSAWTGHAHGDIPPPRTATQYNGIEWTEMVFPGHERMHVFAISDWGSLTGEWYGQSKGAHTMDYQRPGCNMNDMNTCKSSEGSACKVACGYLPGVDSKSQFLVAQAMRDRAKRTGLQFVLNAGDNFYPFGIETTCGTPMDKIAQNTKKQFEEVFQWVYWGKELAGKPWLSVLGNHDYGTRQFHHGPLIISLYVTYFLIQPYLYQHFAK